MSKVLIVYHVFPHYRASVLELLGQYYKSHGDALLCASDISIEKYNGIPCITYANEYEIKPIRNIQIGNFLFQKGLYNLYLNQGEGCVVILLGDVKYISNWLILFHARLTGRKVFLWTHGILYRKNRVHEILLKIYYNLSYGLLLYSHKSRVLLAQIGVSTRMSVIGNSISRMDSVIELDYVITYDVVFIGRVNNSKKPSILLEALKILKDLGVRMTCAIVGEGSEKNALIEFSTHHKLDVQYYGSVYDDLVLSKLLRSSACMVIPSNAGLSVIHAMGQGCPVITTSKETEQKPEVEAIIQNVTGCFYDGTAIDLSAKLITWSEKGRAKVTREKCVEQIRCNYSAESQLQKILIAINNA